MLGYYYYGARYYDPTAGRWTSKDPISGKIANPQSLNRYIFCNNNPIRLIDLLGLEGEALFKETYNKLYNNTEGKNKEVIALNTDHAISWNPYYDEIKNAIENGETEITIEQTFYEGRFATSFTFQLMEDGEYKTPLEVVGELSFAYEEWEKTLTLGDLTEKGRRSAPEYQIAGLLGAHDSGSFNDYKTRSNKGREHIMSRREWDMMSNFIGVRFYELVKYKNKEPIEALSQAYRDWSQLQKDNNRGISGDW